MKTQEEKLPYQRTQATRRLSPQPSGTAKRGRLGHRFNPLARPSAGRSTAELTEGESQFVSHSEELDLCRLSDQSVKHETDMSASSLSQSEQSCALPSDFATTTTSNIPSAVHLSHTQSSAEAENESVEDKKVDSDIMAVKVEPRDGNDDFEITGVETGQGHIPGRDSGLLDSQMDYSYSSQVSDSSFNDGTIQPGYSKCHVSFCVDF